MKYKAASISAAVILGILGVSHFGNESEANTSFAYTTAYIREEPAHSAQVINEKKLKTEAILQPKISIQSISSKNIVASAALSHDANSSGASNISLLSTKIKLDPKYAYQLIIPALSINAPVLPMGNTVDRKMAVPNTFTEVGWYSLGPHPGEIGSAVLGAHVDNGASINGVFKHLKDLGIGSEVIVKDQDGKELHFRVVDRKIYDYNTADTSEVFASAGKPRLNLITCYGTFLPSLGTYAERLVVFTELVE